MLRARSTSDRSEERVENEASSSARKLPSPNQYSPITLKQGVTDDRSLWEWHSKIAATAQTERKNGSIVLTDEAGQEKERWNFVNAWPTKWTGPSFNTTANEVPIETLEISHQGMTKG
jgi:phage tail-like protein